MDRGDIRHDHFVPWGFLCRAIVFCAAWVYTWELDPVALALVVVSWLVKTAEDPSSTLAFFLSLAILPTPCSLPICHSTSLSLTNLVLVAFEHLSLG